MSSQSRQIFVLKAQLDALKAEIYQDLGAYSKALSAYNEAYQTLSDINCSFEKYSFYLTQIALLHAEQGNGILSSKISNEIQLRKTLKLLKNGRKKGESSYQDNQQAIEDILKYLIVSSDDKTSLEEVFQSYINQLRTGKKKEFFDFNDDEIKDLSALLKVLVINQRFNRAEEIIGLLPQQLLSEPKAVLLLNEIADFYWVKNDKQHALIYYLQINTHIENVQNSVIKTPASFIASDYFNTHFHAKTLLKQGITQNSLEYYSEAEKSLLEALKKFEQLHRQGVKMGDGSQKLYFPFLIDCYQALAETQGRTRNIVQMKKYLKLAKKMAEPFKNDDLQIANPFNHEPEREQKLRRVVFQLASVSYSLGYWEEAQQYFVRYLNLSKQSSFKKDPNKVAQVQLLLAHLFLEKNERADAFSAYKKAKIFLLKRLKSKHIALQSLTDRRLFEEQLVSLCGIAHSFSDEEVKKKVYQFLLNNPLTLPFYQQEKKGRKTAYDQLATVDGQYTMLAFKMVFFREQSQLEGCTELDYLDQLKTSLDNLPPFCSSSTIQDYIRRGELYYQLYEAYFRLGPRLFLGKKKTILKKAEHLLSSTEHHLRVKVLIRQIDIFLMEHEAFITQQEKQQVDEFLNLLESNKNLCEEFFTSNNFTKSHLTKLEIVLSLYRFNPERIKNDGDILFLFDYFFQLYYNNNFSVDKHWCELVDNLISYGLGEKSFYTQLLKHLEENEVEGDGVMAQEIEMKMRAELLGLYCKGEYGEEQEELMQEHIEVIQEYHRERGETEEELELYLKVIDYYVQKQRFKEVQSYFELAIEIMENNRENYKEDYIVKLIEYANTKKALGLEGQAREIFKKAEGQVERIEGLNPVWKRVIKKNL